MKYRFEPFGEFKSSPSSHTYNALIYNVNVPRVARKLILTWRLEYKTNDDVLDNKALRLQLDGRYAKGRMQDNVSLLKQTYRYFISSYSEFFLG